MRTPWLLCVVICPNFGPYNTSSRRLQQRGSRDGLAWLTFGAFHTRRASRSRGTRFTRHSRIPLYAHRSSWSDRSMFSGRSLRSRPPWETWSPSDPGSSSTSSVAFWYQATERFIFSTDLVLQQTKLLFDQQFNFRGCLE